MLINPFFLLPWLCRYGMAHVCFAQEKYQQAEVYANKAVSINSCSSISYTQMGLVSTN